MTKDLTTNEWYNLLVDDCKAIVTEAVFISRWTLVEGYHILGDRIVNDIEYQKYAKGNEDFLVRLAGNLNGISTRTLYRAIQFYKKYPVLENVPEGKNISWSKLVNKYLPEHTGKEEKSNHARILKRITRWVKDIEDEVEPNIYKRLSAPIQEIRAILAVEWGLANKSVFIANYQYGITSKEVADRIKELEELPEPEPTSQIEFEPRLLKDEGLDTTNALGEEDRSWMDIVD